jgi:hypothetical protein
MSTITNVTRQSEPVYLSGEYIGTGFSYKIERDCGHTGNLATLAAPPKIGDHDDCLSCHTDELMRQARERVNARRRARYAANKAAA